MRSEKPRPMRHEESSVQCRKNMSARNFLRVFGMVFLLCGNPGSSGAQVGAVVKWPFEQMGAGLNKALLFAQDRRLLPSTVARDPGSVPKEGLAPLFGG